MVTSSKRYVACTCCRSELAYFRRRCKGSVAGVSEKPPDIYLEHNIPRVSILMVDYTSFGGGVKDNQPDAVAVARDTVFHLHSGNTENWALLD